MGTTTFSGPVVSQGGFIDASFTTAERDAIVSPQPGLLIYNTTDNTYQVYSGTAWDTAFGGGSGSSFPLYYIYDNTANINYSNRGAITFNATGTQYVQTMDGAGQLSLMVRSLSTPFDVTTAYTTSYGNLNGTISPASVIGGFFNADGSKYTSVRNYDQPGYYGYGTAQTWTLSSPYDVGSATSLSAPYDFYTGNSGSDVLKAVAFSEDGTKAVFAKSSDMSSQVWVTTTTLSTPFDLSTIGTLVDTPLNNYFTSVPGTNGTFSQLYGMAMNSSGTVAFFTTYNNSYNASYSIELNLGTAYDFSTVSATHYQNLNLSYSGNKGQITVDNANQSAHIINSTMMGLGIQQYELAALSAPNITGVSPSTGTSGTSVTITGTGFTGTSQVLFGGFGSTFTVVSDTEISAQVPGGSGTVDVLVGNPVGSSTEVGAFTYVAAPETFYESTDYAYGYIDPGTNVLYTYSSPVPGRLYDAVNANAAVGKTITIRNNTSGNFSATVTASTVLGPGNAQITIDINSPVGGGYTNSFTLA